MPAGLWTGLIGAYAACLLTLEAAYALAGWSCARNHQLVLHGVMAVGLALVLATGVLSWRAWMPTGARPHDGPGVPSRRFLAGLGVASGLFCILVILALAIPVFIMGACDR